MNLLLLQIAATTSSESTRERQTSAQTLLKDQTRMLLEAYLDKEELESPSALDTKALGRLKLLVKELLSGYDKLPENSFELMTWMNSVLIASSTTKDEDIRLAIQKLVKKASQKELS